LEIRLKCGEKTSKSANQEFKNGDNNKHHGNPGNLRDYFENLYSNESENCEEINKFLDTDDHPKLNQEDNNHLNRYITQN
jgi:hypothetical protein